MFCKFEPYGDKHKCSECGLVVKVPAKANCKKYKEKKLPSLVKRVENFSKAIVQDINEGMKRCTQEEINERLDICKGCELYKKIGDDYGYCSHDDCGCNISSHEKYLNKLYWASQECPLKKWKKIDK